MWNWIFKISAVLGIIWFIKEQKKGGCGCSGESVAPSSVTVNPQGFKYAPKQSVLARNQTVPYGVGVVSSGKGIIEDQKSGRLGEAPYTGRNAP